MGRNAARLEAVHTEISASGAPEASIAVLDLEQALARDYDQVAAAVLERYGRLDGLLHNAGILGTLAPIEHYDVPTWCRVLHVNLTAAFALTQVLLPALKKSAGRLRRLHLQRRRTPGARLLGRVRGVEVCPRGSEPGAGRGAGGHQSRARQRAQSRDATRTAMRRQAYPAEDLETLPLPESITGPYLALLGPASRGVTGGSFDCSGRLRGAASRRGRKRGQLILQSARETDRAPSVRSSAQGTELRAQHAADQGALALEQLAHLLAARAARAAADTSDCCLAAGRLAALHLQVFAAVELADENRRQLRCR